MRKCIGTYHFLTRTLSWARFFSQCGFRAAVLASAVVVLIGACLIGAGWFTVTGFAARLLAANLAENYALQPIPICLPHTRKDSFSAFYQISEQLVPFVN